MTSATKRHYSKAINAVGLAPNNRMHPSPRSEFRMISSMLRAGRVMQGVRRPSTGGENGPEDQDFFRAGR
jgi:hypothetical protein